MFKIGDLETAFYGLREKINEINNRIDCKNWKGVERTKEFKSSLIDIVENFKGGFEKEEVSSVIDSQRDYYQMQGYWLMFNFVNYFKKLSIKENGSIKEVVFNDVEMEIRELNNLQYPIYTGSTPQSDVKNTISKLLFFLYNSGHSEEGRKLKIL